MSQPTEREDGLTLDTESVLGRARELYHIPAVALLLVFMLWNRVRTWENFTAGDELLFRGNDAWYHLRATSYTVENFPFTMPFDPWTYFPYGTASGQFGTLFDQLVALAALVLGLFMPQDQATTTALLFAPAVFGTAVAIPAFFMAKRFGGRLGGVVAVLVLALTPGAFLFRSLVGFSDHHIAEVLFQVVAMFAVMLAVTAAQRERLIYEQFRAREWETLRTPVGYAALAGVALALYVWVWPPAVFFVSVLGLFFLIHAVFTFVRGLSPEHVAVAGVVMCTVAALLSAVRISEFGLSASTFSLLQPLAFLGLAVGLTALAALARVVEGRDDASLTFPGAVFGTIAVVALLAWLVVPDTFSYFVDQFLRIYGLDANAQARTVNEAQPVPLDSASEFFASRYGFSFYIACVGSLVLLAKYLLEDDPRGESLLLVVWFVLMVLATLTQNRFDYYLAVPVAVLTAFVVGYVVRLVGVTSTERVSDIDATQAMTVFVLVLVVVAPFVAVTGPIQNGGLSLQSLESAESNGPGEVTTWESSLEWLANETPQEGQYGTENADGAPMDYYGQYERTDDYEYPDGSYGVMSWWDYGHFITVRGERIPNANPFQQGASAAANFLLNDNESAANDIVAADGEGEGTRYVMVDWKLADPRSNKYTAPASFDDLGVTSYGGENSLIRAAVYAQYFPGSQPQLAYYVRGQAHYDSMRTRLYQFHGSARDPVGPNGQIYVVDWERRSFQYGGGETGEIPALTNGSAQETVKTFDTMAEAREYVQTDSTSQIGGLADIPTETVPALRHYRLVHASEETQRGVGPTVKTFERVEGATVEGTGPANATVTASVELRIPTQDETFVYYQRAATDEDGRFEMTLPYSTTGYDEFGPENGHTNVSVRATGDYEFRYIETGENGTRTVYNGTADVTEAQVLGEDGSPVEVSLEQSATVDPEGNASEGANATQATGDEAPAGADASDDADSTQNDTDGNDSGANDTDANATDDATATPTDGADDTSGGETETATESAAARAAPPVNAVAPRVT